MKSLYKSWYVQIELTNVCWKRCLYCSRFDRHIRKDQKFFMSLDVLRMALESLRGFKGGIGIIGGEPTLHPQFEKVCRMLLEYYPPEKYGLWTTGGKRYERFKPLIKNTFKGMIAYNEHNEDQQKVCKHQPITIAIQDCFIDKEYKQELIDDCWVQQAWCPSISPKGCFFCEVAYALDGILDGPGGWSIESGWWKREPKDFKDQIERYCGYCGMALPQETELIQNQKEKISYGNYETFRRLGLPGITEDECEIVAIYYTKEELKKIKKNWDPGNYRGDLPREGNHTEKRKALGIC